MFGAIRRLAIKLLDGCACTVRWPAVLLELKLVPRLIIKNVEYNSKTKFIEVQVCQKFS